MWQEAAPPLSCLPFFPFFAPAAVPVSELKEVTSWNQPAWQNAWDLADLHEGCAGHEPGYAGRGAF